MKIARTSETSVNFYQSTRHTNPAESHLHTGDRQNLKSKKKRIQCCRSGLWRIVDGLRKIPTFWKKHTVSIIRAEGGRRMFLRNFGTYLRNCTASQPRTSSSSSSSPPREHQILQQKSQPYSPNAIPQNSTSDFCPWKKQDRPHSEVCLLDEGRHELGKDTHCILPRLHLLFCCVEHCDHRLTTQSSVCHTIMASLTDGVSVWLISSVTMQLASEVMN
jgi:hypothetical protein